MSRLKAYTRIVKSRSLSRVLSALCNGGVGGSRLINPSNLWPISQLLLWLELNIDPSVIGLQVEWSIMASALFRNHNLEHFGGHLGAQNGCLA